MPIHANILIGLRGNFPNSLKQKANYKLSGIRLYPQNLYCRFFSVGTVKF